MSNRWLCKAVVGAFLVGACGGGRGGHGPELEAADAASVVETEGALLVAIAESSEPAGKTSRLQTAEQMADTAAARVDEFFTPAGCATATVSQASVAYVLDGCSGPYGLASMGGSVNASFTTGLGGTVIILSAQGLGASGATFDIASVATIEQVDATTRSITVMTEGEATGPRGVTLAREGDYTVTWTASCRTLAGEWMTTVSGLTWTTTVTDLERCGATTCPTAGGSIEHTGPAGRTITVSFDGSDSAGWSASTGEAGDVTLTCDPA